MRFKQSLFLIAVSISLITCKEVPDEVQNEKPLPGKYVDPFIGTGGHGHTYPGATVPFGMVQVSPDNGISDWD